MSSVPLGCDEVRDSEGYTNYEDADEVAIERGRYTRALSRQLKLLVKHNKYVQKSITKDIDSTLARLNFNHQSSEQTLPRTVIHKIYPPSQHSIVDLELTTLDKLQPHAVNHGKYLLLYTTMPPSRRHRGIEDSATYIWTTAYDRADTTKTGKIIEIFNTFVRKPLQEVLPQGTTLRIKEPFYTLCTPSESNHMVVRIDHPTDIEVVYPFAEKDDVHWKRLGDAAFGLRRYHEAVAWYTKGLELADRVNLRANRSAALLEIGRFDECIQDCNKILEIEANFKAIYRRAKAASLLGDPQYFQVFLNSCKDEHSGAAIRLAANIRDRTEESRGEYNWSDMVKEAEGCDYLQRAEFSQKWSIRTAGTKGRGAFANEDIEAGTILVVSKAEAIVYADEELANPSIRIDAVNGRCYRGEQNELASLLGQAIIDNPSKKKGIYELYAGTASADHGIDSFRLHGVQIHNSFETEAVEIMLSALPIRTSQNSPIGTGIWRRPSYFNHSCLNNCTRLFLKDILIIKASRNIKKDEELTLGYVNKLHEYEERKACFMDFGFNCECELCQTDMSDQVDHSNSLLRRRALEDDYQKHVVEAMMKGCLNQAEMCHMQKITGNLVRDILATYESCGRDKYRFSMLRPLNALLTITMQLADWRKAYIIARTIAELASCDAVDDLVLGVYTLLAALLTKFTPTTKVVAGLDATLAMVVYAWKIRGLVPGFKGYWDEFGEWWDGFLVGRQEKLRESVRGRVCSAFVKFGAASKTPAVSIVHVIATEDLQYQS